MSMAPSDTGKLWAMMNQICEGPQFFLFMSFLTSIYFFMMSKSIVLEVSPQNSFSGVSVDHVTVMGFPNVFMRERET